MLYRGLFWALSVREMKTKYAHTAAGWLWILFNPTFNFLILLFVFGVVLNIGESDVPRSIIVLTGLLIWQPFSGALQSGVESFARDLPMMKKIYFPKSYIPLSKLMYNALETLILYFLTLIYLVLFHSQWISLHPGYVLLGVILLLLMSVGIALGVAGLAMRFRDIQYIAPLIVRLGFFASPVGYMSTLVPDKWQLLYYINPAAGAIDLLRAGLFKDTVITANVSVSAIVAVLLLLIGIWFFYKSEYRLSETL